MAKPSPTSKACSKCRRSGPDVLFYAAPDGDGCTAWCVKCYAARPKPPRDVTRARAKRYHHSKGRAMRLMQDYGITIAQYDAMLEQQGGCCAICRKPPTRQRLAVDHCHDTGRVRGLLCFTCNVGIGFLHHSAERLMAARAYLNPATPAAQYDDVMMLM